MADWHPETVGRLEAIEHAAFTSIFDACPDALAEARGIVHREVGGAHCFAVRARPASILWNHATGLGRGREASDADIDAVTTFFGDLGVQATVSIAPDATPGDLTERLVARGFRRGYAWRKFTRGATPPPTVKCDLEIERVGREQRHTFGLIVGEGFETPAWLARWLGELPGRDGWSCYLALDGFRPAAAGAMFIRDRVAWLGMGATLADARGCGAQSALLARRIRDALAAGCELLVTETGEADDGEPEASYRNILRAGFECAYLRPNFVRPAR